MNTAPEDTGCGIRARAVTRIRALASEQRIGSEGAQEHGRAHCEVQAVRAAVEFELLDSVLKFSSAFPGRAGRPGSTESLGTRSVLYRGSPGLVFLFKCDFVG